MKRIVSYIVTVVAVANAFTAGALTLSPEQVAQVGKKYCNDRRTAIWDVECKETPKGLEISGKTDNKDAYNEIVRIANECDNVCKTDIQMLPDAKLAGTHAFTIIPYAHLRTAPGHDKEMATQSLMGNPLRVLERDDDWYRVQTPDNYIAWVVGNSIKIVNDEEFEKWLNAERYIVTDIYTYIYEKPDENSEIVSDVVLGNILTGKEAPNGYYELSTPDGRKGYLKKSSAELLEEWAKQDFDADKIVNTAKRLMGSTYTWGGTSTKGVDCSGLTKTSYFSNAIILQRDASQQVLYGEKIAPKDWEKAKKGDLLYFGTKKGKVTHTAIYMNDGEYVHASGRVKVNSVDPKSAKYLTTPFLSINRINGCLDTDGIKTVRNHPWYFKNINLK